MSIFTLKNNPLTVADYSYNAIVQQVKKIIKYEDKFFAEEDPENLHQIRVGMRRLRSILSVFKCALILPKSINDRKISTLTRNLGQQRDLDILKINLETKFSNNFLEEEQPIIEKIIKKISQYATSKKNHNVEDILSSKKYQNLKEDLISWLENSKYTNISEQKIEIILPDLLFPQISNFFLQSGWLLGTFTNKNNLLQVNQNLSDEEIYELMIQKGNSLHKLRKQAKKTRYQLELFVNFYPFTYKEYLDFIVQVQDTLGDMQDNYTLQEHLTEILGNKWHKKLPNLSNIIKENNLLKWQQWQDLQIKYLSPNFCDNLRKIVIQPLAIIYDES